MENDACGSNATDKCSNATDESYNRVARHVLLYGQLCGDRTGTGTLSVFGTMAEYDISHGGLLLSTKQVFWRNSIKEFLWMISGSSWEKDLSSQGVRIWGPNSDREFLDKQGLTNYQEGELGPVYGRQFRSSGAIYIPRKDYITIVGEEPEHPWSGKKYIEVLEKHYLGTSIRTVLQNLGITDKHIDGVDQVEYIINELIEHSESRRALINLWNPLDIDKMALPPCHMVYHFRRYGDQLDLILYQRSADYMVGVPFNILNASIFAHMIAREISIRTACKVYPRKFVHMMGDTHIYTNHKDLADEQLARESLRPTYVRIKDTHETSVEKNTCKASRSIYELKISDFELSDMYLHHPKISYTFNV
jgi:thymidylate synthase